MKTLKLEEEFKQGEFTFIQKEKNDVAYMYEAKHSSGSIVYEVFRRVLEGNKETYPDENAFGDWAWTFNCPEEAFVKFKNIT